MHHPLPDIDLSTSAGADKEARGRVVVVGGTTETADAVVLAGEAALRAGAGRVALVVVEKGATTTVSHGDLWWRHEQDIRGLAMSGSGDVLVGAIAGLVDGQGSGHG